MTPDMAYAPQFSSVMHSLGSQPCSASDFRQHQLQAGAQQNLLYVPRNGVVCRLDMHVDVRPHMCEYTPMLARPEADQCCRQSDTFEVLLDLCVMLHAGRITGICVDDMKTDGIDLPSNLEWTCLRKSGLRSSNVQKALEIIV